MALSEVYAAVRWSALALAGLAVALGLLWLSSCGCPSAYLYDGTTGPDARPYYKLEKCAGEKPRIVCDSPNKLPNGDCR